MSLDPSSISCMFQFRDPFKIFFQYNCDTASTKGKYTRVSKFMQTCYKW